MIHLYIIDWMKKSELCSVLPICRKKEKGHGWESAWLYVVHVRPLPQKKTLKLRNNRCTSTRETPPADEVHHQAPQSVATATTQHQHVLMSLCPYLVLTSPNSTRQSGCLWNWSEGISEHEVRNTVQVPRRVKSQPSGCWSFHWLRLKCWSEVYRHPSIWTTIS